jgi:peptidoglycan/LPS O-acetylase OafA/YrhL
MTGQHATAASSFERHRLIGLDLVRSLAIVFVVLAHGLGFLYPHHSWMTWAGHLGSFGVDLFFVLSGYLIGGILLRQGPEIGQARGLLRFWLRRWLRTVPNYWLFLALNVPFMLYIWKLPVDIPSFFWRFPLFWQNLTSRHPPFFPESWSLAVEEWFYLILPLLLWLGLKVTRRHQLVVLISAVALLVAPLLARLLMPPPDIWAEDLRKVVIFRLDAIMYGVVMAWCHQRWPHVVRQWRYPLLALGLALLAWTYRDFFVLDLQNSWYARTWLSSVITLGFACCLPWAAALRRLGPDWLETGVHRIALWSYAMYLLNIPMSIWLSQSWGELTARSVGAGWTVFIVYWGLVVGLAAAVFHYFESPILRLRDRLPLCR